MANLVFILGAGASADSGAPLMNDFIKKAEIVRKSGVLSKSDQQAFDLVNSARQKLQRVFVNSRLDIDNIESLYAAFEFGVLIDRLADLQKRDLESLSEAVKKFISWTIEHSILVELPKLAQYLC